MSFNVDGLVSGLDTSALISQLLQVERQPQVRLTQRKETAETAIKAYQALNTRLAAIEDAAAEIDGPLDWQRRTVRSSDDAVLTVAGTPTVPASALAVTVSALARSHVMGSEEVVADSATAAGTVVGSITIGDVTVDDLGDGSLAAAAGAVNASGAGVSAAVVQVAPGRFRLQLSARTTGAGAAFAVTGGGVAWSTVEVGRDAALTVGSGAGAYTVTSSTDTFSGLVGGVNLTVKALGEATITVSDDREGLADRVEALVAATNAALGSIRAQSRYDAATGSGGPLLADSMASRLAQRLTDAVITTSVEGTSAGHVGIELARDGEVTFDRVAFLQAYDADPARAMAVFAGGDHGAAGLAARLRSIAADATDVATGAITTAIEGRQAVVEDLDRQIESWTQRLALREQALRRQFSNLETLLGQLSNQGTWLAGQIAGLPKS